MENKTIHLIIIKPWTSTIDMITCLSFVEITFIFFFLFFFLEGKNTLIKSYDFYLIDEKLHS